MFLKRCRRKGARQWRVGPIHQSAPPHPPPLSSPQSRGSSPPCPQGCIQGSELEGGEAPSVRFRINVSPQGSRKVEGANLLKGTRAGCIQEGTPKSPGAAHGGTKSARGPAAWP